VIPTNLVPRAGRVSLLFALLLALCTAGMVAVVTTPAHAAIGGKRAAILMPFSGGGTTWISRDGPDVHHTFYYGWGGYASRRVHA
jgi:hypothetical protein